MTAVDVAANRIALSLNARGFGKRYSAADPSPCPSLPWQVEQDIERALNDIDSYVTERHASAAERVERKPE